MQENSEIDDIVAELKAGAAPSHEFPTKITIPELTDENVGVYIYTRSAEMIELGMASIRSMQTLIATAADPKEISAYAQLISTISKSIDNLNKIYLQEKQSKNNIEMKKIEAEGRNKNPLLGNSVGQQNNQIFVGSRDDAIKMMNGPKKIELEDNDIIEANVG